MYIVYSVCETCFNVVTRKYLEIAFVQVIYFTTTEGISMYYSVIKDNENLRKRAKFGKHQSQAGVLLSIFLVRVFYIWLRSTLGKRILVGSFLRVYVPRFSAMPDDCRVFTPFRTGFVAHIASVWCDSSFWIIEKSYLKCYPFISMCVSSFVVLRRNRRGFPQG